MKNLILSIAATACLSLQVSAAEQKVELTGNDQMQFSTKTLEFTAGDTVVLTLKHVGQIPKTAMGHNFVLLKSGTVVNDFAMKAMKAAATEYIPDDEESKKAIVAHTKLIGGGESDTVTFTVPAEPGSYPFLCSFPGHFALMQGVATVKAK